MSEDSFPSGRAACSVWTISRHQNSVSHVLIFHRQQAYYSLNGCSFPPSFNDICYFNSTPNSLLFKFSRGRDEEQGTISAFYIRILTFSLLRRRQRCSVLTLCRSLSFLPALFSFKQNWAVRRLSWHFSSVSVTWWKNLTSTYILLQWIILSVIIIKWVYAPDICFNRVIKWKPISIAKQKQTYGTWSRI